MVGLKEENIRALNPEEKQYLKNKYAQVDLKKELHLLHIVGAVGKLHSCDSLCNQTGICEYQAVSFLPELCDSLHLASYFEPLTEKS